MLTKAEHDNRTMRALFDQAGIRHTCLVACVRDALALQPASVTMGELTGQGVPERMGSLGTRIPPPLPPKTGGRKKATRRTSTRKRSED